MKKNFRNNNGVVLMFVGAIAMAIFLLVDMNLSFGLWAAGFIWAMVTSAVGAVLGIIYLLRKIKEEKEEKEKGL